MNGVKTLSSERMAEIRAFRNADFSDCPILSKEELVRLRPRHPEYFKPRKQAIQIRLDADVLAWFKAYGKGYQSRINAVLRAVMLRGVAETKTAFNISDGFDSYGDGASYVAESAPGYRTGKNAK